MKLLFSRILVASAMALAAPLALAQAAFPSKPVTLIIPYPPGGSADVLARALADRLGKTWNVPVIVDNKTGANGIVATQSLMRAAPDGYTILMHLTGVIQNASLYKKLPYDPFTDLVPVTQIGTQVMGLAVSGKSEYKSVSSLVKGLASHPGKGSYGSFGAGSTGHVFGEVLRSAIGTPLPHVPYRGEGPMTLDLVADRLDVAFVSSATAVERSKDGSLQILAVTGPTRQPALPNVPTLGELGFKGFDLVGWYGLFLPKGTPAAIVDRISADANAALAQPEMKSRFQQLAIEPRGTSPKQFENIMREDFRRWDEVFKRFQITLE